MKHLFWICWCAEITVSLCWIANEMKLQHFAPNPYSFITALYLMIVLAFRFGFDADKASVYMVAIPAIPFVAARLLFSCMPYRQVTRAVA